MDINGDVITILQQVHALYVLTHKLTTIFIIIILYCYTTIHNDKNAFDLNLKNLNV